MNLAPSPEEERFRAEVREFLESSLNGEFQRLRGCGGPGREDEMVEGRRAWEAHLGRHGWSGTAWPVEHGGRGLALVQQVVFHEEYARARAPGRLGHIGETLVGPTLIAFGNAGQQARFLPPILDGRELWCQGYSEPGAGSDLAAVATRAELKGDRWIINGQKVWTSSAHLSDWCFVLARTDPGAARHRGLSYLLVPMRQPGVTIRPIVQLTGTHGFNEVFFEDAKTDAAQVVGAPGDGWRVAMGTLAFERGASTLAQVLDFQNEFDTVVEAARAAGTLGDPRLRQVLASVWIRLRIMRFNALRVLAGDPSGASSEGPATITKLYWSGLHRDLGELGARVLGPGGQVIAPGGLSRLQRVLLFSRADTIYGGTDEIQRNVIGERALGLPKEPR